MIKYRAFTSLVALAVILSLIIAAINVGPDIEEKYYPVVTDTGDIKIKISPLYIESVNIVLIGKFNKVRDCALHAISAEIGNSVAGINVYDSEEILSETLSKGLYEFGPWVVTPTIQPNYASDWLVIKGTFMCHKFYHTTSVLVKYKISDIPKFK